MPFPRNKIAYKISRMKNFWCVRNTGGFGFHNDSRRAWSAKTRNNFHFKFNIRLSPRTSSRNTNYHPPYYSKKCRLCVR